MNKSELVNEISKEADITKEKAHKALNGILKTISDVLKKGDSLTLIGFGSFHVRERKAREGRNPKTGEKMEIKSSKTPIFKAGKSLREAVK